jgi:hypothetical protein
MKVRFPNEDYYDEMPNFKMDEFEVRSEFDNEVFGWYDGIYIAVKKPI